MNKISLIFIGTAAIGAPLLESLSNDDRFSVKLVITQVDKPAGRKMELTPPPIKVKSKELRVKSYQPENINSEDSLQNIKSMNPDMIVLMAYGQILKNELLDIPKYGCINVHGSILPKYRGASPIQQSLLEQDDVSGISIMQMVEKMDAGPVFKTADIRVSTEDNAIVLSERLAQLTAYETPNALSSIVRGHLTSEPQNDSKATYCQKIKKSDGEIDWNEDGKTILAKIHAYAGWPGTFTFWNGKRLKILKSQFDGFNGEAGQVFKKDHFTMVGTGKGSLILDQVQIEGKTAQSIDQFVAGYGDFIDGRLG